MTNNNKHVITVKQFKNFLKEAIKEYGIVGSGESESTHEVIPDLDTNKNNGFSSSTHSSKEDVTALNPRYVKDKTNLVTGFIDSLKLEPDTKADVLGMVISHYKKLAILENKKNIA